MNELAQKILARVGSIELLKKHDALNPETARMVLNEPRRTFQKIEQVSVLTKELYGPFEVPDRSVSGLFNFARAQNGIPVGLNPEECHIAIAGQTGCGKSTLIKILFAQILRLIKLHDAPFFIWMFAKADDLRSLLPVHHDIIVVRFKDGIKLNPLEPPFGIDTTDWASIFGDFFNQAFGLMGATRALLVESLSDLYKAYGKHGCYPSLIDLYAYIKSQKYPGMSRTARYQESLVNRLTGLLHGPLGKVFDCSRGHTNTLTGMNTIFEVQYLTTEQEVFMTNYLLSFLFHKKLTNKTGVRHFVAIDDANSIFDASYERRPEFGLPVIHHLLTTVRKSLITIFALTQTPHQIGASILSNSFAKIMFSLSNAKDIEAMQSCMGIRDFEQKNFCFGLSPREAVVKFSGRYQKPFVARVPEVSFSDVYIEDKYVELNNRRLLSGIKIQPGFKPTCSCSGEGTQDAPTEKPAVSVKTETLTERRAKDVLSDIYNRPFSTSTQRANEMNMSAETSTKIYKYLEKNGYAEIVRLNASGKRGGLSSYLVITRKGCEWVKKKPLKHLGQISSKHFFIQHLLKQELVNKGFTEVAVEKELNGKCIDVYGIYEGLKVGIEVCCTTYKTEHENIRKDEEACDRIIIVTPDKKMKEKVLKQLDGKIEPNERVSVCLVSELLNKTEEIILKTDKSK